MSWWFGPNRRMVQTEMHARHGPAVTWAPLQGTRHEGSLAALTLGCGTPIVLVHGLTGSGRYWGDAFGSLGDQHRLIVPDLLGFGRSPRPVGGYTLDGHVAAVLSLLDELDVHEPAVFGAHSAGSVIALRLAASHPERVRAVVAFGTPIYAHEGCARERLARMGAMARLFAMPGRLAKASCGWVCAHRELAGRIAVKLHPGLPKAIVLDSIQHTWESYSQTLTNVVLHSCSQRWLSDVAVPIELVAGDADPVVDLVYLQSLSERARTTVSIWPGNHHLPLTSPADCAARIRAYV